MGYVFGPNGTTQFGVVSTDPEIHYGETTRWVTFQLYFDAFPPEGESGKIKCYCNGPLADYATYLRRGMRVSVDGRVEYRTFVPTKGKDKGKTVEYRKLYVQNLWVMPPMKVWAWMLQSEPIDKITPAEAPQEWQLNNNAETDADF